MSAFSTLLSRNLHRILIGAALLAGLIVGALRGVACLKVALGGAVLAFVFGKCYDRLGSPPSA